jgi:hypothetical protein
MSLRFLLSDLAKGFADVVAKEIQRPFAKASTAAVREPGDIAKRDGRKRVAARENGETRCASTSIRLNATACGLRRSSIARSATGVCSRRVRLSAVTCMEPQP